MLAFFFLFIHFQVQISAQNLLKEHRTGRKELKTDTYYLIIWLLMDATTSWKWKGWGVLWVSTPVLPQQRPILTQDDISQCYTTFWRSFLPYCGSFTWRSEIPGLLLSLFFCFLWNRDKTKQKNNHLVVCMTRKHQLKTILCITYYFMLGWNLGACVNSLYKLRLAGFGKAFVLGKVCGSAFRPVGVRGHGGSRDTLVSASSCPLWEMKTKKQRRLICVLQSFLVGVCEGTGGGGKSLLNV